MAPAGLAPAWSLPEVAVKKYIQHKYKHTKHKNDNDIQPQCTINYNSAEVSVWLQRGTWRWSVCACKMLFRPEAPRPNYRDRSRQNTAFSQDQLTLS